MGAVILATGTAVERDGGGSIARAAAAAQAALAAAQTSVDAVELLVNVGIYRDENMVEPAMAALVAMELGLNPDVLRASNKRGAFALDLMNGACGALNAAQVAGAYFAAGDLSRALVVSSDVHPSGQKPSGDASASFPFAHVGAALLLGKSEPGRGFGRLEVRDGDATTLGSRSLLLRGDTNGRKRITIERDADYADKLLALAGETARKYALAEQLDLRRTLLVTSHPTPEWAAELTRRLEAAACVPAPDVDGDPHSSAPALGWHAAVASGQAAEFADVLFVTAGAGLTCAVCRYRR